MDKKEFKRLLSDSLVKLNKTYDNLDLYEQYKIIMKANPNLKGFTNVVSKHCRIEVLSAQGLKDVIQ